MLDLVKHLRFVHNAQTLLSLIVVYLVISSWTSGNEVLSDLDGFMQTVQVAKRVVDRPENIALLVPSVREARDRRDREVSDTIGRPVTVISPSRIRSMASLPADSASVALQWTELERHSWLLKDIDVPQQTFAAARDWYAQWYVRWGTCVRRFERDRRARRTRFEPTFSYNEVRRSIEPDLRVVVPDWSDESTVVSAMIEMTVYLPESRRYTPCRRRTPRWDYMRDEEWRVSSEREEFGPYRLEVKTETIQLPQGVFETYPHLESQLASIGELTPDEVREWAVSQRTSELRGRESRLFGTTIRGQDLGVVAPAAILALHLYIFITLLSVVPKVSRNSGNEGPLPWLATMKSLLPVAFAWITLALFPAVGAGLALWRLAALNTIASIACSFVVLCLGTLIVAIAQDLGGESSCEE